MEPPLIIVPAFIACIAYIKYTLSRKANDIGTLQEIDIHVGYYSTILKPCISKQKKVKPCVGVIVFRNPSVS